MQNVVTALRKAVTRVPDVLHVEEPAGPSSGFRTGSRRQYEDNLQPDFVAAASEFELTANALSGVVPDDTYTVDDAVNLLGFGRLQIKLSLVTGLCWMADAMEMMILSILSPALYCSWGISSVQQASITTVVFLGMMCSSTLWAKFSDRYGRKTALMISCSMVFYYGFLSAFAPNYHWMLLLRGLVGLAVGCVAQGVTLYAEFIPMTQRGRSVVLLDSFWALGTCFEVILALFVMPTLGWRWLLGFSALPLLLFLISSMWMPESARFYAAAGQYDKAVGVLKRIAVENKKAMPPGRLVVDDTQDVPRGRIRDLLIPEWKSTTIVLGIVWFACAFCYYGIVLMTTEMFHVSDPCHGSEIISSNSTSKCTPPCKVLTTSDYIDLLWTTLAEFPGIFITVIIIEKLGRKKTMAMEFGFFSLSVFPLLICFSSRRVLTFLLFSARCCVSAVFQAAYVYTPELVMVIIHSYHKTGMVLGFLTKRDRRFLLLNLALYVMELFITKVYPTTLRAIGLAMCSTVARLGAMVTPFVAQVMLKISVEATVCIYGVIGIVSMILVMLLPIETKGRGLKECHTR